MAGMVDLAAVAFYFGGRGGQPVVYLVEPGQVGILTETSVRLHTGPSAGNVAGELARLERMTLRGVRLPESDVRNVGPYWWSDAELSMKVNIWRAWTQAGIEELARQLEAAPEKQIWP